MTRCLLVYGSNGRILARMLGDGLLTGSLKRDGHIAVAGKLGVAAPTHGYALPVPKCSGLLISISLNVMMRSNCCKRPIAYR